MRFIAKRTEVRSLCRCWTEGLNRGRDRLIEEGEVSHFAIKCHSDHDKEKALLEIVDGFSI